MGWYIPNLNNEYGYALNRKRARAKPKARQHRTVICTICEETFQTLAVNAKYCSEPCRRLGAKLLEESPNKKKAYVRTPKPLKECIMCGTHFEPLNKVQISCSTQCKQDRKRQTARDLKRAQAKQKVCRHCGNTFDGRIEGRYLYCSEDCFETHRVQTKAEQRRQKKSGAR